ncbi:hypothetical protein [Streptococcus pneumoniae]|uniref:hypothetical protein n=1 Tax=Streptococcus pneumoniae TaxID=1313 RepID=UPI000766D8A6|nr:hypothetical protein [Streptococcus pneumoniae]CWG63782.1 Putative phage lipoprotein [Streptococcus pneumoniae]CWH70200.1 Putative phage lipoprotein [Streptococcus pneumoniae]VOS41511.1 Putative phage lipoprotein [Streptococcus pneumoniae]VOU55715.1 Putative phage lipoprotein [Streptococcus pneumoniae]VQD36807.1 Putative phage lipoprotein [Streptococcus pneumoniae]
MFEPPLVSQLLGTGAVILGFIGAGLLAHQMDKQEEERREEQEFASMIIQGYNHAYERGREAQRQEIRKNIRREFKGFTFDNEPPVGLRPEPLALPEPRRARYANRMG